MTGASRKNAVSIEPNRLSVAGTPASRAADSSPVASRKSDTFGVGYYYLGVSDQLKDLAPVLLPLQNEQGAELYYNIQVTPWCQITPDLQVVSPFRERADTSLLAGLRAKIDF